MGEKFKKLMLADSIECKKKGNLNNEDDIMYFLFELISCAVFFSFF